ncbi:hypothetical protein HPB51_001431 [Rhipicephalus microplus]|uniref:Ubiquitin-conjugating enzyme E2 Z n=1 Tax=Rhipicephalus microplus TaxID=6941 RepID=A0A9J6EF42_RHIMP|nr:hypothetical protein HPB51_001431 [Rhipicephalus microplus]
MRASRWDPKAIEDKTPSAASLYRFVRDIKDIEHKPLPRIYVSPEEDLSKLHAVVVGPPGTPYEDGFFHFFVKCSPSYPIKPPLVRLLTKDAGRVRFNPNLYACGKVCLSILGTEIGLAWSPVQTISNLLLSIQSLLVKEPFLNEPLLAEAFLNDSHDYKRKLEHETIKVTVSNAVEACMQENPPCPLDLVAVIISEFTEHYDKYVRKVKSLLHLTGTVMEKTFLGPNLEDTTFQYKALLTRLMKLNEGLNSTN